MTSVYPSQVHWVRWFKIAVAVFLMMIIIFLSFGFFVFSFLEKNAVETALVTAQTDTVRVSGSMDAAFSSALTLYATMVAEPSFMKNFSLIESTNSGDYFTHYQIRSHINSYLLTAANQNQNVDSIYIYAKRLFASHIGTSTTLDSSIQQTQWWQDVSRAVSEDRTWITTTSFDAMGRDDKTVMAYCRRLIAPSISSNRSYGFLTVNLSLQDLENIILQMGNSTGAYSLLLDSHGTPIVNIGSQYSLTTEQYQAVVTDCLTQQRMGTFIYSSKQHDDLVTSVSSLAQGQFYYVSFVPMSNILLSINRVKSFFILMCTLVLIIIEVLILFFLYITYRPIFNLLKEMKRFQSGHLESHLTYEKNDEIKFIYECYNDMVANINRLIKDTFEQTTFKQQAEIKILQIQINQHFLYNTLEVIFYLCKKEQSEKAGEMILKLSNFYRTFLSNGMEIITLREVVQMLQDYADIMLIRHNYNFSIDIAAPQSILDCQVCKTIFQPFLENAVIHGVERRMSGGNICVTFEDVGESIRYTVTDNGPGIAADVLQVLNEMPEFSLNEPNQFFALQCINYQMKLLYGEAATFRLDSVPLHGTTATILIPKKIP